MEDRKSVDHYSHLLIARGGHARIAREILEEISANAGERQIKAFAQWLTGVNFLGLLDAQTAEAYFQAASVTDPNFDPGGAAEVMLKDQLEPGVNFSNGWGESGSELLQFAEEYVNAWLLTVKARTQEVAGNVEEARRLYAESEAVWGQMNLASPRFPVN